MRIALIEPYFTGSHQSWAENLQKHSSHEIKLFTLPGRHWKWRMYGGAVTLANELLKSDFKPELILATDMLDFATFLGLVRGTYSQIPTAIYFHENQLTYPWSDNDRDKKRKTHVQYAFLNYTSCLVADKIFFNSQYHHDSYIDALPNFLKAFPDFKNASSVQGIRVKSSILPLGLNIPQDIPNKTKNDHKIPTLLWNHRWEYDKNPEDFFKALFRLKAEGVKFKLVLLGESFSLIPPIFQEAQVLLKEEIIHSGHADRATYEKLLSECNLLPVTSVHDYFGVSVVEAIAYGVHPLLPDRLAYPEHIPEEFFDACFYHSDEDLYIKLKIFCTSNQDSIQEVINYVQRYCWNTIILKYDQAFSSLKGLSKSKNG